MNALKVLASFIHAFVFNWSTVVKLEGGLTVANQAFKLGTFLNKRPFTQMGLGASFDTYVKTRYKDMGLNFVLAFLSLDFYASIAPIVKHPIPPVIPVGPAPDNLDREPPIPVVTDEPLGFEPEDFPVR